VVAGGDVLITAGLYNGSSSGSAEERYAPLNADGSVSSFSGATGSNTIFSAGGGNVFNHAAVGYVDGTGAFHVLVIGGDDVDTPTKKHNTVFLYNSRVANGPARLTEVSSARDTCPFLFEG